LDPRKQRRTRRGRQGRILGEKEIWQAIETVLENYVDFSATQINNILIGYN